MLAPTFGGSGDGEIGAVALWGENRPRFYSSPDYNHMILVNQKRLWLTDDRTSKQALVFEDESCSCNERNAAGHCIRWHLAQPVPEDRAWETE